MDISITIDGRKVTVPAGTSLIEAAKSAGIYVPHFCYHNKLSIAANCRMCLVEVEKAPKPLPACATMAVSDMVVRTASPKAKAAQQAVMEFLLINHPLDCPVCDQGGECPLQDQAVGYGLSNSRYGEPKRVVVEKNLGPLISTDMMRCIHCTRCVRFGQEVGGIMELGMVGRGEREEIMPFIEKTVDSELSGNMIDICPVGALTSKPFRFSARTWELRDSPGVSPHDCWGSNLRVQCKGRKVMRVLPRENEQINECWISDRDRFSYEGLNVADRATAPFVRPPGSKRGNEAEWPDALDHVAARIRAHIEEHGPDQIGFLAKANATLEELHLFQKLARGLGVRNIDHRLYQRDFSLDSGQGEHIPWFGMPIESVRKVRHALLVGFNPGNEVPLFGHLLRRIRRSRKARVGSVAQVDMSDQFRQDFSAVVPPSQMPFVLARILKEADGEVPAALDRDVRVDERGLAEFVDALASNASSAVWIGQQALFNPHYGIIRKLATAIARQTNSTIGIKNPGPNSIGAYLAGVLPRLRGQGDEEAGLNARRMVESRLKGYVLLGCEPEDTFDPPGFSGAMRQAELCVSMCAYSTPAREYSGTVLPVAPFSETDGTFVNTEGLPQSFPAAVPPLGEARPAWKVLRILGNRLGLPGFDFDDIADIRDEIISGGADFTERLNNDCDSAELEGAELPGAPGDGSLERIYEVASYGTDAVVRRAPALQRTLRGRRARDVAVHPDTAAKLGLRAGDPVTVAAGDTEVGRRLRIDARLAAGCVRIPIGYPELADLGSAEHIRLSPAPEEKAEAAA